jgi:hypothetical protein
LRIKAGCQGAQLKILNNELPYGYAGSAYNATIYAEGGVPFPSGGKYRWCIKGNLPPGFYPTSNFVSSDCYKLSEDSWVQADNLKISSDDPLAQVTGKPTAPGSYTLTFYARDNQDPSDPSGSNDNDNIAQKTLVLTINPSPCTSYSLSISNQGTVKSYKIEPGQCQILLLGSISIDGLSSNNILTIYSTVLCPDIIDNILLQRTMQSLDSNGDCKVNVSCQGNNCSAN